MKSSFVNSFNNGINKIFIVSIIVYTVGVFIFGLLFNKVFLTFALIFSNAPDNAGPDEIPIFAFIESSISHL